MSVDLQTLELLRASVSRFAKPDPAAVRALRASKAGFNRESWQLMAAQGWLAVGSDAGEEGALGLSAAVAIARPLGYGLRSEPFSQAIQASICLADGGPTAYCGDVLESIVSGELVPAVAASPEGTCDVVLAKRGTSGFVLDGTCRCVEPGNADAFVVAGLSEGEPALLWVQGASEGLSRHEVAAPDGYPLADIELRNVGVPFNQVIATGAQAQRRTLKAFDGALIVQSAELLGLIDRVLELTLDYLRTRRQFDRPIGSFQSLQHRAVDLWIQQQLTEAAVTSAAAVFDAPSSVPEQRSAAASAAKARAASAAMTVCNQAVQLHGAIGITDEYELALHLQRALRICASLGNSFLHRRRYDRYAPQPQVAA
jgi:alkylation response protein AidB-like acyl-CoA dehydrogenase